MARTRTLTQLIADVRTLSDTQNLTVRHGDSDITRAINQAIQRFREKLSTEGIAHYLVSYTTTTTVGATSPYPFQTLDLSAISPAVVRVYAVHVTFNNYVTPLEGIEFTEITRYQDNWRGILSGKPLAFANYRTDKLALVPPPDQGYTLVIWYLPVLPDLVAPGDTFDGVSGWEDWVVHEACMAIANRDRDMTQIQALGAERDRHWSEIIRSAGRVNRATTTRRRDTLQDRMLRTSMAMRRLP